MCRIVYIVLVLAALSGISANGSPVRPAKAHRHAPATSVSHSPHKKATHATPQEVGRAAGLKIRRNLAHRPAKAASLRSPSRVNPLPPPQNSEDQIAQAAIRPTAKRAATLRRTRLVTTPPLRGSYISLVRQNEKLEAEGLERIEDEDDLSGRIAHKLLVPVPASAALLVNSNLPEQHRYCRPWTARFLTDLARIHAAQFHRPLEVSSAVRTVEYQKRLQETNGNAAPAEGDIVSPHLTGATIDIAKQGLSRQELGWMRRWLLSLEAVGKIDVEEEFQQACFHITVYKNYVPAKPTSRASQAKEAQPKTGTSPSEQRKTRQSTLPSEPAMATTQTSQGM
ncbi:MAG: DUF5715 family protein [Terracidiphilus sp.]|nr:DUF5715 family protein [Terracidiphilus sp.]